MPTIQIAVNRGGGWVREPVEAEMFDVDGLELAVHPHPIVAKSGWWSVTEPQTGCCIGNGKPTRQAAVDQATELVRFHGIERVKQSIAKTLAKDNAAEPEPQKPKGNLVGITRAELEDVAKAAIHAEPREDALVAVALAAQRAMVKEIIYHDYPGQLLDLQDKLGVRP